MAALVFLELNGIEVEADETEFERLVLDVAENKSSKGTIAEYLREARREDMTPADGGSHVPG